MVAWAAEGWWGARRCALAKASAAPSAHLGPISTTPDRSRASMSPADVAEPVQNGSGTASRDAEKRCWLGCQRHQRGPGTGYTVARSTCSRARRRLAPPPRSTCSPRAPSQLRAGRHGAAGAADRQRGAASKPGPAARRPAVVGGRAEARAVGGWGTGRCTTQRAPAAHLAGLDTWQGAPASSWSGRGGGCGRAGGWF